jgi:hypothetical protein
MSRDTGSAGGGPAVGIGNTFTPPKSQLDVAEPLSPRKFLCLAAKYRKLRRVHEDFIFKSALI